MPRRAHLLLLLVTVLTLGMAAPALAGSARDETIAERSVLNEDDVAAYDLSPTSGSDDLPPNVTACKKIRALSRAADRRPQAESQFADDLGTNAFSRVIVYPNARAAKASVLAYSTDTGVDCLNATLERDLDASLADGSTAEFTGEALEVRLGDSSIVYQIVVTVTDDEGGVGEIYLELGLVQVGRGLAQLAFQAQGEPFPGSEDLATIVIDNMESNL